MAEFAKRLKREIKLMTEWSVIYKSSTLAVDHYENFPVASVFLPAHLRPAVEAIYRWARQADDLADEGDLAADERRAALEAMAADLDRIAAVRTPLDPVARALVPHVADWNLPLNEFQKLLGAFTQDVAVARYANRADLIDYCERSANPIGRLMLRLFGASTPQNIAWSDAICTALQLTNFWQDVARDWNKGRLYVPLDRLSAHGIDECMIAACCAGARCEPAWRRLMAEQVGETRALLESGAPLAGALRGRVGWEMRLILEGGRRILDRIETVDYDVFRQRPALRAYDWGVMLLRAVSR